MKVKFFEPRPQLRYFDELRVKEWASVDERRRKLGRKPLGTPIVPPSGKKPVTTHNDNTLAAPPTGPDDMRLGGTNPPDHARLHPRPQPCNATGLALSGGGIRSAAFCLGALQALHVHKYVRGTDFLSTVSGGGYVGCCLAAASNGNGFPFQSDADICDSPAVGHLRNYSNYLLPRARSSLRNAAEAAVIVLRGLLANGVLLLAALLLSSLLTSSAYPNAASLAGGSFLPRLADSLAMPFGLFSLNVIFGPNPFRLTLITFATLAGVLLSWAVARSRGHLAAANDTNSGFLRVARWLCCFAVVSAGLDSLPLLISGLSELYRAGANSFTATAINVAIWILVAVIGTAGLLSGRIGKFLKLSEQISDSRTLWLRFGSRAVIWMAALAVPSLLLLLYLHMAAWVIPGTAIPSPWAAITEGWLRQLIPDWIASPIRLTWEVGRWILLKLPGVAALSDSQLGYLEAFIVIWGVGFIFRPNAYSLHQFYRDRLSKAFLFDPEILNKVTFEPQPKDTMRLSEIKTTDVPYPIINAAMNVQGSLAANQRGRNAEFFTFTPQFIGSDLTLYMESTDSRLDRDLDLASAMAISGAAFSANMGSNTLKPLSPTLALLNIRLGYWLQNPRDLAKPRLSGRLSSFAGRNLADLAEFFGLKAYLVLEMFNQLTESSKSVYLTDGGHIENLGVYQLLKRGCQFIIAIDSECDPDFSMPSLMKLERYARIDLGIRMDLPWREISRQAKQTKQSFATGAADPNNHGPHCALGRIVYADGSEGVLLYVKSSLSGDEPDYVLDHRRRNPRFPHETTGDQFFTEEQFEAYRALGFHIVDRALARRDTVALSEELEASVDDVFQWMRAIIDSPLGAEPETGDVSEALVK